MLLLPKYVYFLLTGSIFDREVFVEIICISMLPSPRRQNFTEELFALHVMMVVSAKC